MNLIKELVTKYIKNELSKNEAENIAFLIFHYDNYKDEYYKQMADSILNSDVVQEINYITEKGKQLNTFELLMKISECFNEKIYLYYYNEDKNKDNVKRYGTVINNITFIGNSEHELRKEIIEFFAIKQLDYYLKNNIPIERYSNDYDLRIDIHYYNLALEYLDSIKEKLQG